jgi:reverse gyrase
LSGPDVFITKVNETYIRISPKEQHIAQEIADNFTFFANNYKYHPLFKKHRWDGKIRLYSLSKQLLYTGLLPDIIDFCKSKKLNFVVDAALKPFQEIPYSFIKSYCSNLNLFANGELIEVKPFQFQAIYQILNTKRSMILCPTGSGKSLISYVTSRYLQSIGLKKGLILVPTTSLVEQLYSDFCEYSLHNAYDVPSNVHRIYQGKEKNPIYFDIELENGKIIKNLLGNEYMKILNSPVKKQIIDLTEKDEVDYEWAIRVYSKQIL